MKVPIKVVYQDGGTKQVVATARDAVAFERRYSMPYARIWGVPPIKDVHGATVVLGVPPQEEWWYFLAWSVLARTGEDVREFDAFVNAIEGVDVGNLDEEPDPVPFPQAPTGGSSDGSPPPE